MITKDYLIELIIGVLTFLLAFVRKNKKQFLNHILLSIRDWLLGTNTGEILALAKVAVFERIKEKTGCAVCGYIELKKEPCEWRTLAQSEYGKDLRQVDTSDAPHLLPFINLVTQKPCFFSIEKGSSVFNMLHSLGFNDIHCLPLTKNERIIIGIVLFDKYKTFPKDESEYVKTQFLKLINELINEKHQ